MDCFYSGMKKSLTALAFGTLGLGIAEFVMMGILPDVAKDLHISIPQAGHFISAYALGVCVGAPGMVLVARTRPRECGPGVAICGSGEGISMTLNKHQGIRAALCWMPEIAHLSRQHNDANVLVMPGRFIDHEMAEKILDEFFNSGFEGGRHQKRIEKIPVK